MVRWDASLSGHANPTSAVHDGSRTVCAPTGNATTVNDAATAARTIQVRPTGRVMCELCQTASVPARTSIGRAVEIGAVVARDSVQSDHVATVSCKSTTLDVVSLHQVRETWSLCIKWS